MLSADRYLILKVPTPFPPLNMCTNMKWPCPCEIAKLKIKTPTAVLKLSLPHTQKVDCTLNYHERICIIKN